MSLIRTRTIRLICTASLLLASGCTLTLLAMAVDEPVCPTCPADTKFSHAIDVGSISGGKPHKYGDDLNINDGTLRDALARSLASNNFLSAAPGLGRYVLDVHIVEGPHPRGDFATTANAAIRYAVDKKVTGERVFEELIHTSATLSVIQMPHRPERGVRVVQISIKKNIKKFLLRLNSEAQIAPKQVSNRRTTDDR